MSRNPYLDAPRYATVAEANIVYGSITEEAGVPLAWIESLGGLCAYDTEEDVWKRVVLKDTDITAEDPDNIFEFSDDFVEYVDGDVWTAINNDSGTVAVGDSKLGVIDLTTAVADNAQIYIHSTNEIVLVEPNKSIEFKARVKLAEADTDKANIIVGLADAVADDILADDGAGLPGDYDGFLFLKVDEGTVWQAEASNETTQDTAADAGDFEDDTWTWLRIVVEAGATTASAKFYVNNVLGATLTYTISGSELMHAVFGVKAGKPTGGGAAAEKLEVDKVVIRQIR